MVFNLLLVQKLGCVIRLRVGNFIYHELLIDAFDPLIKKLLLCLCDKHARVHYQAVHGLCCGPQVQVNFVLWCRVSE